MLEFTILPNPKKIKGHIIFFIDIKIKLDRAVKDITERIYFELRDYLILSKIFNSKDTVGLVLACEDVFKIERIRSSIESMDGITHHVLLKY